MKHLTKLIASLCLSASLTGCGVFHLYQPTVQQGNVLSEKQVRDLHKGMSKHEVIAILGEPVMDNSYNPDQLNYVYTLQKNGGKIHQRQLILTFKNGRLTQIDNQYH